MHPDGPKRRSPLLISILAAGLFCRADAQQNSGSWKPDIPRTWVDEEIATLEVPLADAASSPQHARDSRLLLPHSSPSDFQDVSCVCAWQGTFGLHRAAPSVGA